jgi:hypothetical protein
MTNARRDQLERAIRWLEKWHGSQPMAQDGAFDHQALADLLDEAEARGRRAGIEEADDACLMVLAKYDPDAPVSDVMFQAVQECSQAIRALTKHGEKP